MPSFVPLRRCLGRVGLALLLAAPSGADLLGESADTAIAYDWPGSQLGASVASAGDVNGDGYGDVIVGAPLQGVGGAALVLLGSPTGVGTAGALIQCSQAVAELGASVAGAGDVNGDGYDDVIIGAPRYDAGQTDEGAAFVFLGSASGIASGTEADADARLEADQTGSGSQGDLAPFLGTSVAGAGDVNGDGYDDVIVGAPGYDAGIADEGAAFVFLGSAAGIADGSPATAHARFESDQGGTALLDRWPFLGRSVAGAGDVDGDGYDDVIVGAPSYNAGQTDEGAAFVFLGSASGVANGNPATAHAQLESNQVGAGFGTSVAGSFDVDGDGFDDVIVGAPGYMGGLPGEGAAFVFRGSPAGVPDGGPLTAKAQLESNQGGSGTFGDFAPALGTSVAGVGDVNGDGTDDWIAGAPFYDGSAAESGAAFVMLGSAAYAGAKLFLGPADAYAHLDPGQGGGFFGTRLGASVASAGDVNGDGLGDVIVGAPFFDTVFDTLPVEAGAAFVYHGTPPPPPCGAVPSAPVAGLVHRYSFCGDVSDSVGAQHGTVVDAGTTLHHAFVNGSLDLSANPVEMSGGIAEGAYVDLPNGLVSWAAFSGAYGALSVELWFSVAQTRSWQRLWDFGGVYGVPEDVSFGPDTDYIALSPNSGLHTNGLALLSYLALPPSLTDVGAPGPFPTGVLQHVVAVFDHYDTSAGPNGTIRLYRNGMAVGTPAQIAADPGGAALHLPVLIDHNNWLGRSQWAQDALFAGLYDELRIYDIALDPAAVAASYVLGPEFLPEPAGPVPLLLGIATLLALRRRGCRGGAAASRRTWPGPSARRGSARRPRAGAPGW